MARGFLTSKRTKIGEGETLRARTDDYAHDMYYQKSDYEIVDRVIELAARLSVKPAQIALAWLLHQPGITSPIIGASKMFHLEEAVSTLDIAFSDEDCSYLEQPYQPHVVLGHD